MHLPFLKWAFVLAGLVAISSSYAITGPLGGVDALTGQRPLRQEISSFQHAGPAFDLYILAFQAFAQQDQTEPLSYYQVAGIHGHPYTSWDGVNGGFQMGYCTHGSILFPTWHRPYLALFEQILWNHAQDIASTYPEPRRAEYQAAAQTLRMPYWDWSINPTMPDVVNQPMININAPDGAQSIVNPLYNYTFHPQPSATDFPPDEKLAAYTSTVRYPDAMGQSQPSLVNAQLSKLAPQLHSMTYQLIAQEPDYAMFSNTAYNDGRGTGLYNSIENMHNAIHAIVGNGGHMSIIPFSAFDPIFWLHHTNVDRLFAIWQAIYPNTSYAASQPDAIGTFTNAPSTTEDFNTPLTPFHSDTSGDLYTSLTARSTHSFGYTYPEIIDWGISPSQLAINARTALNQLYNPGGSLSRRRSFNTSSSTTTTTPASPINHQYFVNIKVNSTEITDPLFIHFFIGTIPSPPRSWSTAPTLAGTYAAMAHTDGMAVGQVALTHALVSGIIADLSPQNVIPYLSTQLDYRIQKLDWSVVGVGEVRSLRVSVVVREVELVEGEDQFPRYGPLVEYGLATRRLVGGVRRGEGM